MRDLSIYIHIPFCVRKCLYCDFLSFAVGEETSDRMERKAEREKETETEAGAGDCPDWKEKTADQMMESYVELLKREIIMAAEQCRSCQVISVFWGGGTPSLLPAFAVARIMELLRRYYHVLPDAEITIEVNPGTVTADKLWQYKMAGINRLSIGLQSTDDGELRRIGRIHDYRTFLETYRLARETGFCNINIDLMAALPGQSTASYRESLRRIAELMPEHISAYSLLLEEGTPLYEQQEAYSFPTEEEDRDMYLLTDTYLSACGYHRYEISNYAREGYECRHNKVYWQRGDYLGFGLGASSMMENVRWSNPAQFVQYEAALNGRRMPAEILDSHSYHADGEDVWDTEGMVSGMDRSGSAAEQSAMPGRQILTRQEQMEEYMFLGLRMMCGVSRRKFADQFGQQIEEVYGKALDRLYRQQLLVCEGDRIKLTVRGIDVSNYVMAEFLLD